MSFELALRATEILLAFAFILQSAEHVYAARDERFLYGLRLFLSTFLLLGFFSSVICALLCINALCILWRFQGPYNGGSDRMGLLILLCLTLSHILPYAQWRELAFGYLAVQLALSYFMSGAVKIIHPDWRNGRALRDVFLFSVYPASENLRGLVKKPLVLFCASWAVIVFELIFPIAFLTQESLLFALFCAALFHLANACLFGLNRFFWIWLAAYPSILWLQSAVLF